jgi:uncharacterized protein
LLDELPAPPDISALDGFLVGVLLQPTTVPEAQWLRWVHDFDDGRPAAEALNLTAAHALVRRRHAELGRAIAERRWFDPWVFELEPAADGVATSPSKMVLPWIAGFAAALERFPALMAQADTDAQEPLATLYANFDPADLEDADDLAALIEQIAPPLTAAEAVEDLVRCTLLLADAMQTPTFATSTSRARKRR